MSHRPIEDHGIIGDMRTAALVAIDGSIDWMCYPRFDSPSVFAALLDDQRGGRFRISSAAEELDFKQFYWPETNVLVTRFLSSEGMGELVDFMPMGHGREPSALIRQLRVVRGRMHFEVDCQPRFDYGRADHTTELVSGGAVFESPSLALQLASDAALERRARGVGAELVLREGDSAVFELSGTEPGARRAGSFDPDRADEQFERTVRFWRDWVSQSSYRGRWIEQVHRSALVLKLLSYEPSGAIIAAPTTSLPEVVGGVRNWDYRYTWIRDAAFTVYGLLRVGFREEAARFMDWAEARCREMEDDARLLHNIYRVDGSPDLPEQDLEHLDGYRGSRPVRIGNAANQQLQLDIAGALMDAAYLSNKYATPTSHDLWQQLRRLTDWVAKQWQERDESIWEVRGEPQHFVYSKLMCWVAVDRLLRLADKRSLPVDRARHEQLRDEIYEDLMKQGWSPKRRSFVQAYGGDQLDAATLIMPLVFFVSPNDPRMLGTLDALQQPPHNGGLMQGGLIYRYDPLRTDDGLPGEEGSFNLCTFWLVEALTRAGRTDPARLERARLLFEQMLGYSNHLGLYAEETGPRGEALGNFPQAFAHLSLISAAFNLDRALG